MEQHVVGCDACSVLDQRVRRSLVVARNNAPRIEASSAFSGSLARRLEEERMRLRASPPPFRFPAGSGAIALGGAFAILAVLGMAAGLSSPPDIARHHAVDVSPDLHGDGMTSTTPAFVSSFSTGMAIIPALLLVEEVPLRFAGERSPGERRSVLSSGR
jgi:uncharacterized membrane protein YfcA